MSLNYIVNQKLPLNQRKWYRSVLRISWIISCTGHMWDHKNNSFIGQWKFKEMVSWLDDFLLKTVHFDKQNKILKKRNLLFYLLCIFKTYKSEFANKGLICTQSTKVKTLHQNARIVSVCLTVKTGYIWYTNILQLLQKLLP